VETVFIVPQDGTWYTVKIEFFMFDDGDGGFASDSEAARAEMLRRFPGAFEVPADSVTAQFVTGGFKWLAGTASWGYNGTGAPSGVAGTAVGAIQAAAATWGQQGAAFAFSGGSPSSAGTGACGGGTDGNNTVGWANQSGSVLAVTCSWYGSGNPFNPAVEFDMQIDPEWTWTTGSPIGVDLQSVALHELGHALGLNHSGDGSAVMFASYTQGSSKRAPAQDDIDGELAIYGPSGGQPTSTPTTGPTKTPTNTPSPSNTPTNTPTNTPSPTPTNTPGGQPTNTPTATPTNPNNGSATPTPPLSTSTPAPTVTPGSTSTPGPTNTPTPSPTATQTAVATPTSTQPPSSPRLPLSPGANLLAWPGGDVAPSVALATVPNLRVVYGYDPATGKWSRYVPGGPGFLNSMTMMKKGAAYWFIAAGAAQVPFTP
jgi:hypothetical protein